MTAQEAVNVYRMARFGNNDGLKKLLSVIFFFQAEDGIRDSVASRGLGDVYKRQLLASRPYRSKVA